MSSDFQKPQPNSVKAVPPVTGAIVTDRDETCMHAQWRTAVCSNCTAIMMITTTISTLSVLLLSAHSSVSAPRVYSSDRAITLRPFKDGIALGCELDALVLKPS
eukprot:14655-Heterococcus_DN1.PRE.2